MKKKRERIKLDDYYSDVREWQRNSDSKEPFYIIGGNFGCTLIPFSVEAISEFYKHELKFTKKINYFETLRFLAFFFEHGEKAMKGRATFAKIFHNSNVMKLMPQMIPLVKKHVQNLREKVEESKEKRLEVDLKKELLLEMFEDLTGCILLTGADKQIRAKFDGMTVSEILKKMFNLYDATARNPVSYLPFAERLSFVKEANEFRRLQNGFRKIITDAHKDRYNFASEENLLETSMIYIMV